MLLRSRLVAWVIVALLTSLALGGAVVLVNAKRSVRNEMRAALEVGRQTIDAGLRDIGRHTGLQREIDSKAGPRRVVEALIAPFKGGRHLRVLAIGRDLNLRIDPVRAHPPFRQAPAWFAWLVGVEPQAARVPLTIAGRSLGTVVIETDPTNELLEAWTELSSGFLVLMLFCGLTVGVIYLFTGRALRPLDRLALALEQVGRGDYETLRIGGRLTPELARLRDSFNLMAARLAAADANNRRLTEQMSTLQEEERSDLARDLHDEVGPLLFAIGVDVGTMMRLVSESGSDGLVAPLRSIAEAAQQLQRHVRGMLGRLRPIALAEFGLAEALHGLVGFWRRRQPEIEFRCVVAAGCDGLRAGLDMTVYRVVQECLNNAVRHGRPTTIAIEVAHNAADDEISVAVTDDGRGLPDEAAPGYGLIGMAERVRAAGGRLTLANRPAGGLAVRAALPCARPEAVS
ncbi:MAG TPA: ATP-binding protein [Stellaceae bacterium]|nr:ATP-binding protein [Stellaceae bacterium]